MYSDLGSNILGLSVVFFLDPVLGTAQDGMNSFMLVWFLKGEIWLHLVIPMI